NDAYPGGYVYRLYLAPTEQNGELIYDLQPETPNEMLAHLKKYVINASGGNIGSSQDASNDLHLLRLSDVYFVYAEATLRGDLSARLSGDAVDYVNDVLSDHGANYSIEAGTLDYLGLLNERRKEFALEGINWFDIQRLASLDAQAAVDYLNGMYRDMVWTPDWKRIGEEFGASLSDEQTYQTRGNMSYYVRQWYTPLADDYTDVLGNGSLARGDVPDTPNRNAAIVMNRSNLVIAIPSDALTKAPLLLEPAVDYYND
ncbi:MAG: RagB/SusD family nutrient uptake outer membrane protein, partial [Alistipes sp.]|nr:RagB/SusD family nutrient uptake outer membrane protein [Alistipes sp.]